MGQFLRTNGDYNIVTREGGKIVLNTGPTGETLVTGNLVVEGTTLTVSAEDLEITDNIITLNKGESGEGVSLRYSGIEIDRGFAVDSSALPKAAFVYDEGINAFIIAEGTEGSYSFANSALKLRTITTDAGVDNGDLTFSFPSNVGVLKTDRDPSAYKAEITSGSDIPNKLYVDDAIRDNPTFQIIDDNTRVIVSDKDVAGSLAYLFDNTGYTTGPENLSAVSILVDNTLIAQFFNNRLEIGNLEIGGGDNGTDVTTKDGISNENINIRTQGTGKVAIDYALQLLDLGGTEPGYVSNAGLLHAGPVSIGTTGLYFVNDSLTDPVTSVNPSNPTNNDTRYQRGELISKNKALLFSMLF